MRRRPQAVAKNGTKAGGVGDVARFSFFPSKNLAVSGEGGMMTTRQKTWVPGWTPLVVTAGMPDLNRMKWA